MVNQSAARLAAEYKPVLSHEVERVERLMSFIDQVHEKTRELGLRLFSIVGLTRYIWEHKLDNGFHHFRNFDRMVTQSAVFEKVPMNHTALVASSLASIGLHSIKQRNLKALEDLPKQKLIALKPLPNALRKEDVEKLAREFYAIPADHIIVREITGNRLVLTYSQMDELSAILKREVEAFRRAGLPTESKNFYLSEVSSRVVGNATKAALNNLVQKLFKVFREVDTLLKDLSLHIYIFQDSSQPVAESQVREDHKATEFHYQQCFPNARHYNFQSQKKLVGQVTRPFAKALDKFLLLEKEPVADFSLGFLPEEEELQPEVSMNIELVKKMIEAQKSKAGKSLVNQSAVRSAKSESKREPTAFIRNQNEFLKSRDASNNQRKEILEYGTLLRSLNSVLDLQAKDSLSSRKVPTILDAKIQDRTLVSKMRNMLGILQSPNGHKLRQRYETMLAANSLSAAQTSRELKSLAEASKCSRGLSSRQIPFSKVGPFLQTPLDEYGSDRAFSRQASGGDVVRSNMKKKLHFIVNSPAVDTEATKRTNSKEQPETLAQPTVASFKISSGARGGFSPRGSSPKLSVQTAASQLKRKLPSAFKMPADFLKRNGMYRVTEAEADRRLQRSTERRLEEDLDSYTLSPFTK